ncbi:hypothetical protein [Halocatena salina]|uniref:Uncharacterized protein n=1 Tax=Halocatena salina TaxID=2934340 RepID=A0A8U0A6X1_9EURY|nr:hypothetical protein [Halocatena salina]UPM44930.1 hypothetical protein MW046_16190 [Halocatena salina]
MTKKELLRRYTVPPDAINYGGGNVIAARVYDGNSGVGLHDDPLGPIVATE